MDDKRYRKIGTEKVSTFYKNFDVMYTKYKTIAEALGYGEIKLVKENKMVLVYIVI